MMIEQKEAVIFDLDGTMTDSMWIWEEIDQDFFRQQGLPMPEHLHEEIEGMSFTETVESYCFGQIYTRNHTETGAG